MRPYRPLMLAAALFLPAPLLADDAGREPADDAPAFEILMESPQPEGWPEPGPAFEMTLKHFPAYRAAVKEGGNGFWPLFRHISARDIPMTAPVEMDMQDSEEGYRMTSMAFLYQSIEVGETGEAEDGVEVIDYPAISVVSYGSNGRYNQERIDEILADIDEYLETLAEDWRPTGEMRIMGYNSPMVPSEKRYFEVQVLVEPVEDESAEPATDPDPNAE